MYKIVATLAALLLFCAPKGYAEPLDLKDFLTRATAANTSLKASAREELIAAEQEGVAKSGYLPRVDVQGGYQAQLEPQAISFDRLSVATQDADFPFASLAINQTLYDFGRTRMRTESARLQTDAVKALHQANEQDVFLQVVRAYYGILEGKKVVQAAQDELGQMTSHQKTAQALYDEGVVTRNDLLQAEVRVAASRQKLLAAQNAVENGWLVLNYLSGHPAAFRAELREGPELGALTVPPAAADFSGRGELVALQNTVKADELAVKELKTGWFPEFFLRLSLDYVKNTKLEEQAIYAATAGFRVNLFDGFATTSRLRAAVQARARDEERVRDLKERLSLELGTARNDLAVAQERIKVSEKAIQQGVENLRITKDRYQEKVGTATDVVDAQTLLTQTRTDYFRSIFDLEVAAARVKRAMGQL